VRCRDQGVIERRSVCERPRSGALGCGQGVELPMTFVTLFGSLAIEKGWR
jgi:hypothetical protein